MTRIAVVYIFDDVDGVPKLDETDQYNQIQVPYEVIERAMRPDPRIARIEALCDLANASRYEWDGAKVAFVGDLLAILRPDQHADGISDVYDKLREA